MEKFIKITQNNIDLGLSLLSLFKQQAYEHLDNLHCELAINHTASHQLFEVTHAIKGASLSIAAEKVSDLSTIIEHQIRDNIQIDHKHYYHLIEATQELLYYITAIETRQSLLK